jgi:REP element-mobilizing transposase RayT
VIAGRTYLISRRCTQRQYLLRPDPRVEQIYLYCLGEAAERFGVTLHAWIAMSNHQHLVIRDNRGNFPDFLAHLHKMIAKALNAHWGRWENFWATEQPNAVYLVESADRLDKLVYLLANPVIDHLVERVADWPGASSLRLTLTNGTRTVRRPRGFFRDDGPMPDEVTLRAQRPAGFEALEAKEWRDRISSELRKAEQAAAAQRGQNKTRVLGRKNVLRASHTDRPSTVEPRRGLRPCVACQSVERRKHELGVLMSFRRAYRQARVRWIAGHRRVVFPCGTFRLRTFRVRCARATTATAAAPPFVD